MGFSYSAPQDNRHDTRIPVRSAKRDVDDDVVVHLRRIVLVAENYRKRHSRLAQRRGSDGHRFAVAHIIRHAFFGCGRILGSSESGEDSCLHLVPVICRFDVRTISSAMRR
jgi:hypothetical protein